MNARRPKELLFFGLSLCIACGCERAETVSHYRVAKEEKAPEAPAGPHRMLAVLVPHGEKAWFFRLSGPTDEVATQADKFQELLKTVRFDDATGDPAWTLPTGWREKPDPGIRQATIETDSPGEKRLEVAVTVLPLSESDLNSYKLANVNRWRGQLGLSPIPILRLRDDVQDLSVAGETAMLFDHTGRLADSGMSAPFAGGRAPGAERDKMPRKEER